MKLAKEMRDLSELELNEKVTDLKQELFNLRFQHAVNQLENPQRIKAVKKQIAIIKTIQRERELSVSAGNAQASGIRG
ncbi:MAG: 50S ribosomal protein L29 [Oscillospiraceae bacterium]|jgi:large subunit ribosomal protein L29|nr:50S ribosomal protein L29 [Oscillospiraceae bacterium]